MTFTGTHKYTEYQKTHSVISKTQHVKAEKDDLKEPEESMTKACLRMKKKASILLIPSL